jgi:hypothetical protein
MKNLSGHQRISVAEDLTKTIVKQQDNLLPGELI